MATPHVTARELARLMPGSLERHEDMVEAVLQRLALAQIPAAPIHTGARVKPRPGGGWELYGQKRGQLGMADVMACLPPTGQLLLIDCKSGRAQLSAVQREFRARFEKCGAIYLELRDVAELEPYLRRAGLQSAVAATLGGGTASSSGMRPTGVAGRPPLFVSGKKVSR